MLLQRWVKIKVDHEWLVWDLNPGHTYTPQPQPSMLWDNIGQYPWAITTGWRKVKFVRWRQHAYLIHGSCKMFYCFSCVYFREHTQIWQRPRLFWLIPQQKTWSSCTNTTPSFSDICPVMISILGNVWPRTNLTILKTLFICHVTEVSHNAAILPSELRLIMQGWVSVEVQE